MSRIVLRTISRTSTYVSVVISPATTTRPVVISVSQATRAFGSSARIASRSESEIWSAILSGCPSVTDSDVNENVRATGRKATCAGPQIGSPRVRPDRESRRRSRRRSARASGSDWLLGRRRAAHELLNEIGQRRTLEDGAHAFGDRELDPKAM